MTTQIQLTLADGRRILIAVEENKTSRELLSLLPLTLNFEDYNRTEKVTPPLAVKLTTEGSPEGYDPDTGDFCLYAPWGNLCLFYRDFGYAGGLIKLGTVISGQEYLKETEGAVTLERISRGQ